jgi:hypothetical protein
MIKEQLSKPYFFDSNSSTSSNTDSLILDGSMTEILLNQNHYIIEVSNSNVKKITLPLISSYKYSLFYIIRKICEGDLEIETSGDDMILSDKKITMSEIDQVLQLTNNKNNIWFII